MSEIVRFIRKGGRIIPIRSKKKKEAKESAALLSAGVGIAGGGAVVSGSLLKKARHLRNQGRIGAQMMRASDSTRVGLKDFGLTKKLKSFKFTKVKKSKIDSFARLRSPIIKGFEKGKRVKAYKSAFRARKVFKASNIVSSALVGLGVEKALSASGLEDKSLFGDLTSETIGVGSALVTHSISTNIENKIARGISLRSGFKKDIVKGFKGIGKFLIKRKAKI